MQRLIVFVFLFLTLGSLQHKSSPERLSQHQMVSILVDLQLARAMIDYYTDDEKTASQLLQENARLIYEAYDITPDRFSKSYQYYLTQLGIMGRIYDAVVSRLEELKEKNGREEP